MTKTLAQLEAALEALDCEIEDIDGQITELESRVDDDDAYLVFDLRAQREWLEQKRDPLVDEYLRRKEGTR